MSPVSLCSWGSLVCSVWFYRVKVRQRTNIQSLAVLPLENLSGEVSQDYFADGMTDELITDLAKISALRVISRTSVMVYKGARKPLPQIARELNVDAVVEGTVVQAGDRVRITAQLIQVPADKHLWAESYEGNVRDTLALQNKVARAIAEQIRIKLTPGEQAALNSGKPVDPGAYQEYLKGRYFWNKRTADGLQKARDHFNQAIDVRPRLCGCLQWIGRYVRSSGRLAIRRDDHQGGIAKSESSRTEGIATGREP